MNDVMKLAKDRRDELHQEVSRIDEFIRMADSLMSKTDTGSGPAEATRSHGSDDETPAAPNRDAASGVTRMNLLRRGMPSAAG